MEKSRKAAGLAALAAGALTPVQRHRVPYNLEVHGKCSRCGRWHSTLKVWQELGETFARCPKTGDKIPVKIPQTAVVHRISEPTPTVFKKHRAIGPSYTAPAQ